MSENENGNGGLSANNRVDLGEEDGGDNKCARSENGSIESGLPSWVSTISSEVNLCFVLPLVFWILASAVLYFSIGWGKDFRVVTSLLWGGITLFSLFSFFVFLVAISVISDLVIVPSLKSPFSIFYRRAACLDGRARNLMLALGLSKVLILAGGFIAIFGGVWTIGLWLSSGVFLKAGA